MKHLHELTPEQKTRLLAELDGWTFVPSKDTHGKAHPEYYHHQESNSYEYDGLNYPTSYDAIIPLVQKLDRMTFIEGLLLDMGRSMPLLATPSQLCDAVLVATGKAEV